LTTESAVDTVPHPAPFGTKHKFALAAIQAPAAGHGGRPQDAKSFAERQPWHVLAKLDDGRAHLMS
jgi:hypothetical protein